MAQPWIHALTGLLSALVFAAQAEERPLSDIVQQVKPSVVGVGTVLAIRRPPAKLLGTGFAIGDGTLVATNHHVVPDTLDVERKEHLVVFVGRGRDTGIRRAEVVAQDITHDLALLRIEGSPLPALSLAAADTVLEGEGIAFTGFPIGAILGLYPVTHRGIVSAISPIAIPARHSQELSASQIKTLRNPFDVLQLDATAYPGNSGSPVYRRGTGEVIGVINQVLVKGKKENVLKDPSAITYAIPIMYLNRLLQNLETN